MSKNYEDTCRICLNNDVNCLKFEIFVKDEKNYAEKINHVTGLYITEDDGFPHKICSLCSENLDVAYDFKVNCLLSDDILRKQPVVDATKSDDPAVIVQEAILKLRNKSPKRKSSRKSKELSNETKNQKIPQEQDYECFICNKYFDLISEKDIHVRRDHQNDPKVCPICNTKKQTAFSFESHLRYHKFGYRFLCSTCGRSFRFKNLLESHLRIEHTDSYYPYICDLCSYNTKFKINLQRHIKSFHLKIRNFVCSYESCNAQYSTQVGLNLHLYRAHHVEPPVKCTECQQGFTFDSELRVHKKHCRGLKKSKNTLNDSSVDAVENGYQCKICQQVYETRSKWIIHYHHKHKNSNICKFCNKQMASSTSLLKHIRVQHEKIKKFLCEICNKSFGFKHSLDSHLNSHKGLKPFACDFEACNFRTGDRSCISKHKKKCHKLPAT
ncbi:zinc finger protein 761-like [Chironomus tepperi]|uniref:zinc finger protein 761-like n=1 Tax=Chironomus tepperi TaxID=113505 RepID=UPI00391F4068